jgi:hypothetical protein
MERKNKASLLPKIRFTERKGRFSAKQGLGLPFLSWNIPL